MQLVMQVSLEVEKATKGYNT